MNLKVKISDLLPNPFRQLEHYKIDEGKVSELVNSFKVSGYWPIIIARKNAGGKYETAYGEHRKAAFRRLYGDDAEIEIIVRPLTEELMLKMMANENSETWSSSFINEMETVQSVVKAFAIGQITLPKPALTGPKSLLRNAPSFTKNELHSDRCKAPYSIQTVAEFLGWLTPKGRAQERVALALEALELLEQEIIKVDQLIGLSGDKAQAVIREASLTDKHVAIESANLNERLDYVEQEAKRTKNPQRRAKLEDEADEIKEQVTRIATLPQKVAERVSATLREKSVSSKTARDTTDSVLAQARVSRKLPSDREFVVNLAVEISKFLDPHLDKTRAEQIKAVLDNQSEIDAAAIRRLVKAFDHHIGVCQTWLDKLKQDNNGEKKTSNRALLLK